MSEMHLCIEIEKQIVLQTHALFKVITVHENFKGVWCGVGSKAVKLEMPAVTVGVSSLVEIIAWSGCKIEGRLTVVLF